jgi:hypothetical protein
MNTRMASAAFAELFAPVSKAALVDALWCACQLGTDDSPEQYLTNAARNVVIALRERGDRVPPSIQRAADLTIESDVPDEPGSR